MLISYEGYLVSHENIQPRAHTRREEVIVQGQTLRHLARRTIIVDLVA